MLSSGPTAFQPSPLAPPPLQAPPKDAAVKPVGQTSGGGINAELSQEQRQQVDQLKARDREVRNHEQAHARVGGAYAGEPSYTYQTGPDGKRYAIGGEVPIDVSTVPDDPEATIAKMEIVKAAALAPAEPSGQDRKVAALADAQRIAAMADLRAEQANELSSLTEEEPAGLFAPLLEDAPKQLDLRA